MSTLRQKFEELSRTYPPQMRPSLVLPLLQHLQEEKGFLTHEDALAVADCTGVPPVQALEVLSWYTMLYRKPVGQHVIKVMTDLGMQDLELRTRELFTECLVSLGAIKPDGDLFTLTREDKAIIAALPKPQQDQFAFLCFLADQWIDSDHAVALLEYVSDPHAFQRLATLPPDQVIRTLARVEAGFAAAPGSSGPVAKPSASQAHPPIKPLGSAPRAPDADDGSDDEPFESFLRRENAKDRKAGRLG